MRKERQIELLERVANAGERLEGLYGESSMVNQASHYCNPERFEVELEALFRGGPVFFCMSADLPQPGDWRSMQLAGTPMVVVRQADGSLRALVNICRHRASSLVDSHGSGTGLKVFSCPYHAWTYEIDGKLRSRPAAERSFDDVAINCDLLNRPVAEKHGLIFVRLSGDEAVDVDTALSGAQDDLGDFGLGDWTLVESRSEEWNLNWKFFYDSFSETYHIRTLHRDTIGPAFTSDGIIFEPFGRNSLSIGLRSDTRDEFKKPKDTWSILPFGTIQYFLPPTGMIVHQLDHLEVWNVEPLAVNRSRFTASVYAPTEPETEKSRDYFVKNLELLLNVTGTEDYPALEDIQRNLASGALEHVVYGKIEAPLVHFHQEINKAVQAVS